MPIATVRLCIAALAFALPAVAHAQGFVRLEVIPVPTLSLSAREILAGETTGRSTIVAGELRIPKRGTDKLPAIILVHGSGGINDSLDDWARELNGIGLAVFVLDSFAGRGIVSTVTDQSQLDHLAMMVDTYRALGVLAQHPRIDAARIAVIGFSKGAVAAVYSSARRFRKQFGGTNEFAAHIGIYAPCNTAFRDDSKVTGKPIRLFHGTTDDWVPIAPCRALVTRLKQAGTDITLTEYPNAYHGYDNPTFTKAVRVTQAQNERNCVLEEGDRGAIVNASTRKPFTPADACVERGAQLAYNATAHKATVTAVKEFLAATLKLKP
jgi:dienelactone hydrolase